MPATEKKEPSYRGEPRPGNHTFALTQRAIDNGWNPGGGNKVKSYKFRFFLTEQFIEMVFEGYEDNPYMTPYRLRVSEYIFSHKFAKALVGKERYRKFLQDAVISKFPIDYMYKKVIAKGKNK